MTFMQYESRMVPKYKPHYTQFTQPLFIQTTVTHNFTNASITNQTHLIEPTNSTQIPNNTSNSSVNVKAEPRIGLFISILM